MRTIQEDEGLTMGELDVEECLVLLRWEVLGRLAVSVPMTRPRWCRSTSCMHDGNGAVPSRGDGEKLRLLREQPVSLQVDRFDLYRRLGWTSASGPRGRSRPRRRRRPRPRAVRPPVERTHLLQIVPSTITAVGSTRPRRPSTAVATCDGPGDAVVSFEPAAVVETHVSTLFFADDVVGSARSPCAPRSSTSAPSNSPGCRRARGHAQPPHRTRCVPRRSRRASMLKTGLRSRWCSCAAFRAIGGSPRCVTDCVAGDTEIDKIAPRRRDLPRRCSPLARDRRRERCERSARLVASRCRPARHVCRLGTGLRRWWPRSARSAGSTSKAASRSSSRASRVGDACDGHGDLQAADIFCLDDGPRILDCLEFDDDLRYGDALGRRCLPRHGPRAAGRAGAARRFLHTYQELAATPGPHPSHTITSRTARSCGPRWPASVPTKATPARPGRHERSSLSATGTCSTPGRCSVVGGSPGTGKTTVAAAVADAFGAVLLSSDELRKDLAGVERTQHGSDDLGRGLYAPERVDQVYRVLLEEAAVLPRARRAGRARRNVARPRAPRPR